ncbi:MAG: putative colanic acid biosynthesis acetyltransferase [Bacteroidales bacterium]|nr:putative colanic acid biosynthesis acetyltransferase [Bacteroidales bacterium]
MSRYYSKKEILLRIIWGVVQPTLFRLSPRLFYSWRNFLLRLMGAKIGKGVQIFPSVDITFPWLLEVGDKSVIAWNVKVYNLGMIKIGKQTIISQNAHLCGGTHDITHPGFVLKRTGLTIGNKVWIAADAFIGPNVTVGDNSIVAARAVVIKDVDSQSMVGGNPAKLIKKTVGYRGEA